VTLAGAALGQTVLAKATLAIGLEWDSSAAHAAAYDAERTADLFCKVCNFCLPSFLEAEKRVRELGWIEEPAAPSNGVDPTSPVAAESP